jgi:hypothetical protein
MFLLISRLPFSAAAPSLLFLHRFSCFLDASDAAVSDSAAPSFASNSTFFCTRLAFDSATSDSVALESASHPHCILTALLNLAHESMINIYRRWQKFGQISKIIN